MFLNIHGSSGWSGDRYGSYGADCVGRGGGAGMCVLCGDMRVTLLMAFETAWGRGGVRVAEDIE